MRAPERIWTNFCEANRLHIAYDEPPRHPDDDCKDAYILVTAHEAAVAAARAEGMRVKPLEWKPHPFSQSTIDECAIADAPFSHRYQIQRDPWAPTFLAMLFPRIPISDSTLWWESKGHGDLEDAKAAAQADYEARILAALGASK